MAENKDGWFPAETLLKFKKIKEAEVGICEIVEACMDSKVVQVNDAQTHIKRRYPLNGTFWVKERTIQAKGFPKENCSLNELILFWAKVCPSVRKVQFCGKNLYKPPTMRRVGDRKQARVTGDAAAYHSNK